MGLLLIGAMRLGASKLPATLGEGPSVKESIRNWNLWWVTGGVAPEKRGIPRGQYLVAIERMVPAEEIVCVAGVRRSGKSTLMYQTIQRLLDKGIPPKNILYVNLHDPAFSRSTQGLDEILTGYRELNAPGGRAYIFLDEVQNIPGWERWMKAVYDKKENVKFFVSGSNSSLLSTRLSTLLTGRMLKLIVFPLSFREFLDFRGVTIRDIDVDKTMVHHHLTKYLEEGGFPRAVLEENRELRQQLLREYYDGILLRDVLQRSDIKFPSKMIDLAQFVASNIGNLLSYKRTGERVDISDDVTKEYLALLESAFMIFQVNFFSFSVKETVAKQKPRKAYFIDTGMRNAAGFRFSADRGRLMENVVLLELKRRGKEVYYWKGTKEVDFMVKEGDKIEALNVCHVPAKAEPRPQELAGLIEAMTHFELKEATLITWDAERDERVGKKLIHYVPLSKWLLS
jgi:predicted AAA+ superfamily ATPase